VLRQDRFFAGRPVHSDGTKDLAWFGPDGTEMSHERWHEASLRTLQMYLHAVVPDGRGGHGDESLLVVVQGGNRPDAVRLPGPPWAARYRLLWDSDHAYPPGHEQGPPPAEEAGGALLVIDGPTLRVYGVVGEADGR
jgi:isoamylase